MVERGVVHGRFQVFHNDHLRYLLAGKSRCRQLVVGITNPDPMLTRDDQADRLRSDPASNPLTYFERYTMVRAVLQEAGLDDAELSIVPFPVNIPELYQYYLPLDAVFYLTIYDAWGRRKLAQFQTMGLKTEVLWVRTPDKKGVNARDIRRKMVLGEPWEHMAPPATVDLMKKWGIPDRLRKFDGTALTDNSAEARRQGVRDFVLR
ncbi:MAG: nicotinate-nucleotide adenylyltransferase [Syntrophobacteraceae bacterium]